MGRDEWMGGNEQMGVKEWMDWMRLDELDWMKVDGRVWTTSSNILLA